MTIAEDVEKEINNKVHNNSNNNSLASSVEQELLSQPFMQQQPVTNNIVTPQPVAQPVNTQPQIQTPVVTPQPQLKVEAQQSTIPINEVPGKNQMVPWYFRPFYRLGHDVKSGFSGLGKNLFEGAKDIVPSAIDYAKSFLNLNTRDKATTSLLRGVVSAIDAVPNLIINTPGAIVNSMAGKEVIPHVPSANEAIDAWRENVEARKLLSQNTNVDTNGNPINGYVDVNGNYHSTYIPEEPNYLEQLLSGANSNTVVRNGQEVDANRFGEGAGVFIAPMGELGAIGKGAKVLTVANKVKKLNAGLKLNSKVYKSMASKTEGLGTYNRLETLAEKQRRLQKKFKPKSTTVKDALNNMGLAGIANVAASGDGTVEGSTQVFGEGAGMGAIMHGAGKGVKVGGKVLNKTVAKPTVDLLAKNPQIANAMATGQMLLGNDKSSNANIQKHIDLKKMISDNQSLNKRISTTDSKMLEAIKGLPENEYNEFSDHLAKGDFQAATDIINRNRNKIIEAESKGEKVPSEVKRIQEENEAKLSNEILNGWKKLDEIAKRTEDSTTNENTQSGINTPKNNETHANEPSNGSKGKTLEEELNFEKYEPKKTKMNYKSITPEEIWENSDKELFDLYKTKCIERGLPEKDFKTFNKTYGINERDFKSVTNFLMNNDLQQFIDDFKGISNKEFTKEDFKNLVKKIYGNNRVERYIAEDGTAKYRIVKQSKDDTRKRFRNWSFYEENKPHTYKYKRRVSNLDLLSGNLKDEYVVTKDGRKVYSDNLKVDKDGVYYEVTSNGYSSKAPYLGKTDKTVIRSLSDNKNTKEVEGTKPFNRKYDIGNNAEGKVTKLDYVKPEEKSSGTFDLQKISDKADVENLFEYGENKDALKDYIFVDENGELISDALEPNSGKLKKGYTIAGNYGTTKSGHQVKILRRTTPNEYMTKEGTYLKADEEANRQQETANFKEYQENEYKNEVEGAGTKSKDGSEYFNGFHEVTANKEVPNAFKDDIKQRDLIKFVDEYKNTKTNWLSSRRLNKYLSKLDIQDRKIAIEAIYDILDNDVEKLKPKNVLDAQNFDNSKTKKAEAIRKRFENNLARLDKSIKLEGYTPSKLSQQKANEILNDVLMNEAKNQVAEFNSNTGFMAKGERKNHNSQIKALNNNIKNMSKNDVETNLRNVFQNAKDKQSLYNRLYNKLNENKYNGTRKHGTELLNKVANEIDHEIKTKNYMQNNDISNAISELKDAVDKNDIKTIDKILWDNNHELHKQYGVDEYAQEVISDAYRLKADDFIRRLKDWKKEAQELYKDKSKSDQYYTRIKANADTLYKLRKEYKKLKRIIVNSYTEFYEKNLEKASYKTDEGFVPFEDLLNSRRGEVDAYYKPTSKNDRFNERTKEDEYLLNRKYDIKKGDYITEETYIDENGRAQIRRNLKNIIDELDKEFAANTKENLYNYFRQEGEKASPEATKAIKEHHKIVNSSDYKSYERLIKEAEENIRSYEKKLENIERGEKFGNYYDEEKRLTRQKLKKSQKDLNKLQKDVEEKYGNKLKELEEKSKETINEYQTEGAFDIDKFSKFKDAIKDDNYIVDKDIYDIVKSKITNDTIKRQIENGYKRIENGYEPLPKQKEAFKNLLDVVRNEQTAINETYGGLAEYLKRKKVDEPKQTQAFGIAKTISEGGDLSKKINEVPEGYEHDFIKGLSDYGMSTKNIVDAITHFSNEKRGRGILVKLFNRKLPVETAKRLNKDLRTVFRPQDVIQSVLRGENNVNDIRSLTKLFNDNDLFCVMDNLNHSNSGEFTVIRSEVLKGSEGRTFIEETAHEFIHKAIAKLREEGRLNEYSDLFDGLTEEDCDIAANANLRYNGFLETEEGKIYLKGQNNLSIDKLFEYDEIFKNGKKFQDAVLSAKEEIVVENIAKKLGDIYDRTRERNYLGRHNNGGMDRTIIHSENTNAKSNGEIRRGEGNRRETSVNGVQENGYNNRRNSEETARRIARGKEIFDSLYDKNLNQDEHIKKVQNLSDEDLTAFREYAKSLSSEDIASHIGNGNNRLFDSFRKKAESSKFDTRKFEDIFNLSDDKRAFKDRLDALRGENEKIKIEYKTITKSQAEGYKAKFGSEYTKGFGNKSGKSFEKTGLTGTKNQYSPLSRDIVSNAMSILQDNIRLKNAENLVEHIKENFSNKYTEGDINNNSYVRVNSNILFNAIAYRKTPQWVEAVSSGDKGIENVFKGDKVAINDFKQLYHYSKELDLNIPEYVYRQLFDGSGEETASFYKNYVKSPKNLLNKNGRDYLKRWVGHTADLVNKQFVKKVLATPRFLIGNFIGNQISLLAKADTIGDYLKGVKDALTTRSKDIPSEIAEDTFMASYFEHKGSGKPTGYKWFDEFNDLLDGKPMSDEWFKFEETKDKSLKGELKNIGKNAYHKLGNSTVGAYGVASTGLFQGITRANNIVEKFSRKQAYSQVLSKMQRKKLLKDCNSILNTKHFMENIDKYPELKKVVISKVYDILGDYDNYSPFEKKVLKKAIPFYSWCRTVARFHAKLIAEDPSRFFVYAYSMYQNFYNPNTAKNKDRADWQYGAVKLGDTGTVFTIKNLMPASDAVETAKSVKNFGNRITGQSKQNTISELSSLSPVITKPVNMITGKNTFYYKPEFQDDEYMYVKIKNENPNIDKNYYKGYLDKNTGILHKNMPLKLRAKLFSKGIIDTLFPGIEMLKGVGTMMNDVDENGNHKHRGLPDISNDTFGGQYYGDTFYNGTIRNKSGEWISSQPIIRGYDYKKDEVKKSIPKNMKVTKLFTGRIQKDTAINKGN